MSRYNLRHRPIGAPPAWALIACAVLAGVGLVSLLGAFVGLSAVRPLGIPLVLSSLLILTYRRTAEMTRGHRLAPAARGVALSGALFLAGALGASFSHMAAPAPAAAAVAACLALAGGLATLVLQTLSALANADKRMPEGGV